MLILLSSQSNKRESQSESCKSACKNVDCNQHDQHTNSTCSMLGNVAECSGISGEDSTIQVQNASNNPTIIESRTKGVSCAPQTHSGPTGPPPDKDNPCKEIIAEEGEDLKQTCSSSNQVTKESASNSSVSSSSKATIQRQKRLRTPVWARSMSTNKTYIKFLFAIINFDLN